MAPSQSPGGANVWTQQGGAYIRLGGRRSGWKQSGERDRAGGSGGESRGRAGLRWGGGDTETGGTMRTEIMGRTSGVWIHNLLGFVLFTPLLYSP